MTQAATPSVSAVMWMSYAEGRFTKVASTLGRECREWPTEITKGKILTLVEEHSRPGVVVVFADGSVLRGVKSGWGFSERVGFTCHFTII